MAVVCMCVHTDMTVMVHGCCVHADMTVMVHGCCVHADMTVMVHGCCACVCACRHDSYGPWLLCACRHGLNVS